MDTNTRRIFKPGTCPNPERPTPSLHSNAALRFLAMEPYQRQFENWKNKWDEKVEVLSMRERGEDWGDILALFSRRGVVKKNRRSWYHDQRKVIEAVSIPPFV
jgi:hypothetical protein